MLVLNAAEKSTMNQVVMSAAIAVIPSAADFLEKATYTDYPLLPAGRQGSRN